MKNKRSGSFVKQLFGYSLSSWVSCVIGFVSVPIVTNLFLPEELGKINLYNSYLNLFLAFCYFGMDQTYTRFYNDPPGKNDKRSIFTVCITISLIITLLISLGILIFSDAISSTIIGYPSLVVTVTLIVGIAAHLVLRFLNLASRMQKNLLLYSVQAITITVLTKLSYVVVAIWKADALYAILVIGASFAVTALVFLLIKYKSVMRRTADWSKEALSTVLKFGVPLIPATAFAILNNNLPQIFIKEYSSGAGYDTVGIYSNAANIASIITIIQSGFQNFWGPFVYENYKTKNALIIKVHHIISVAMVMMGICICIGQPVIYAILVGKNYSSSAYLFPFLLLSPICYTISETLGIGIRLENKTYWNVVTYFITFVVNTGLCLLLLPRMGVVGGAIASAASAIAMLVVKAVIGERYYRCSDGYIRLVVIIGIMILTAAINYVLYDSIWKYAVFVGALFAVLLVYVKEVRFVASYLLNFLKKRAEKG